MTKRDKGKIFSGIVLILLGLSISGINLFAGFGQNTILLLLGGLFIAWYFYSNSYGLLIPGCILAGLGLSSLGSHYFWNSPHNSTLGIGLGFVAVFVIDLLHKGKSPWWPLIPGGIMVLSALSQGAFGMRNLFHIGWPLILIILGLWIIGKSTGIFKGRDKKDSEKPLNKD
ncbi:MAG: hypothetical protein Q7J16_02030 [Candidatus Cloacimonadales bacterium]|nr:hypothetical protein [Candidatus Cloacimonadales bacterium]